MKNIFIFILIICLIGLGVYFVTKNQNKNENQNMYYGSELKNLYINHTDYENTALPTQKDQ